MSRCVQVVSEIAIKGNWIICYEEINCIKFKKNTKVEVASSIYCSWIISDVMYRVSKESWFDGGEWKKRVTPDEKL